MKRAVFIGEGTSDNPLADIVTALFARLDLRIDVTKPDFELLPRIPRDVGSRVTATLQLTQKPIDLFIVHRDADSRDYAARRREIADAIGTSAPHKCHIPVVPVQATESWLLLDEHQIRIVAGNPRGRNDLRLPAPNEVERRADPKKLLAEALLAASNESGRRRERVVKRFNEHRRRLLSMLDIDGPVNRLSSFKQLVADVKAARETLTEPQ